MKMNHDSWGYNTSRSQEKKQRVSHLVFACLSSSTQSSIGQKLKGRLQQSEVLFKYGVTKVSVFG